MNTYIIEHMFMGKEFYSSKEMHIYIINTYVYLIIFKIWYLHDNIFDYVTIQLIFIPGIPTSL